MTTIDHLADQYGLFGLVLKDPNLITFVALMLVGLDDFRLAIWLYQCAIYRLAMGLAIGWQLNGN